MFPCTDKFPKPGCQKRFEVANQGLHMFKRHTAVPKSDWQCQFPTRFPKPGCQRRFQQLEVPKQGSQAGFPHVAKWQRKVPRHFPRPAYQRSFGVPKQGCHMFHRQRGNARIPQGSQSQIAKEGSRIPSRPPTSKGRLGMPAIKYKPTFMDL